MQRSSATRVGRGLRERRALNTKRSDGECESGAQQPISFPSHPRGTLGEEKRREAREARREKELPVVAFTPFTRSPSGKFVRKLAEPY